MSDLLAWGGYLAIGLAVAFLAVAAGSGFVHASLPELPPARTNRAVVG